VRAWLRRRRHGDRPAAERGAGVTVDLGAVRAAFEQPEIEIVATLGMGEAASEAWGCDLSEEYVRINADYTT